MGQNCLRLVVITDVRAKLATVTSNKDHGGAYHDVVRVRANLIWSLCWNKLINTLLNDVGIECFYRFSHSLCHCSNCWWWVFSRLNTGKALMNNCEAVTLCWLNWMINRLIWIGNMILQVAFCCDIEASLSNIRQILVNHHQGLLNSW